MVVGFYIFRGVPLVFAGVYILPAIAAFVKQDI